MCVVIGLLVIPEPPQSFYHGVLRFGLTGVNDVIYLGNIAEVGMVGLAVGRGYPTLVAVGIKIKLAVAEVATQQTELPQVIGDVFAYVADGSVGTHDNFLVFFGNRGVLGILFVVGEDPRRFSF